MNKPNSAKINHPTHVCYKLIEPHKIHMLCTFAQLMPDITYIQKNKCIFLDLFAPC